MAPAPSREAATGFLILALLLGSCTARPGLSAAENSEGIDDLSRQGRKLQFDLWGALWNAAINVGTTAATSTITSGFSGGGGSKSSPTSGGGSVGGGSGGGGGSCPSMGSCCCWDTSKNPCNPKCSGSASSCGSACQ